MKRTTLIFCAASAILVPSLGPAPAHAGGGLLKQALGSLGSAVGDALQQEAAAIGEEMLETARVESVDSSIRPSVVVRTDDGATFQLQNLTFVSMGWLDRILDRVQRIDFEPADGDEYRLRIVYAERPASRGGIFRRATFSTARRLVATRIGEEAVPLPGLVGKSLDGSRWVMVPANHGLASIEFLHVASDS